MLIDDAGRDDGEAVNERAPNHRPCGSKPPLPQGTSRKRKKKKNPFKGKPREEKRKGHRSQRRKKSYHPNCRKNLSPLIRLLKKKMAKTGKSGEEAVKMRVKGDL